VRLTRDPGGSYACETRLGDFRASAIRYGFLTIDRVLFQLGDLSREAGFLLYRADTAAHQVECVEVRRMSERGNSE